MIGAVNKLTLAIRAAQTPAIMVNIIAVNAYFSFYKPPNWEATENPTIKQITIIDIAKPNSCFQE